MIMSENGYLSARKKLTVIAAFIWLMLIFHIVIIIISVIIRAGIIARRIKVLENRGKFVGGLIIRFEPRRIFCICQSRRIKETCNPQRQHARQRNPLFSSRRPPCQCVDALNWLVILIEFHYPPTRQWTERRSTNENERAEQPHFPRLITEKRFTRACRAGDSKKRGQFAWHKSCGRLRCENVFRRARVKRPARRWLNSVNFWSRTIKRDQYKLVCILKLVLNEILKCATIFSV